jgi:ABC-2 type transport system permease protein
LLPSLTGTVLTPLGVYPASWLTGESALYAGVSGWLHFLRPTPGAESALASIGLLVVLGLMPLAVTNVVLNRRLTRS